MYKLLEIDDLIRPDHTFLNGDDECYYFHDYTTDHSGSFTVGNSLISNFKKKPDRIGKPEWKYKNIAINDVVDLLKSCRYKSDKIIIPIPPSKIKKDKLYDNRISKTLEIYSKTTSRAQIMEIFSFKKSMPASHESLIRPTPDDIYNNLIVDKSTLKYLKGDVIIFDDVVTTGAHFKACKRLLLEFIPDCNLTGLFIARRVIKRQAGVDF